MVVGRVAGALEQQRGVLLVIAVHHNRIEVLAHQFLNRSEGFGAGNDGEIQLAENLRYGASRLLIGAEKERLITHTEVIVGTLVSLIKLRW